MKKVEEQYIEWLERHLDEARENMKTADIYNYANANARYLAILGVYNKAKEVWGL